MNFYLQKADSCKVKFDYANSYKYISEILTYAKENKDFNTEILCNIKLIEIYRHAALFNRSEKYLNRVTALIKEHKSKVNHYNLMFFYNRKAALFSEYYRMPDSTLIYSKKALQIAEKLKNNSFKFTCLMEIGYVYEQKNDLENGIKFYLKSYEFAKSIKDKSQTCDALVNSARVFEKLKKFTSAIEKCDEGLKLLENDDNYFQKLLFYDTKQNAFEHLGDKSSAYDNLKLRLKYTDLFYENNAKEKLLEEEQQQEILNRDHQLLKSKEDYEKARKNQFYLVFIILLFIFGLLSSLYYSNKVKIANKQLDIYSKENAFLLNEAYHRINNNLQLIIVLLNEELDKLEHSETDQSSILKILSKLESISTLHRHLYQSKDKKSVDIEIYLNEIVNNFKELFIEKEIKVHYEIKKLDISIDIAMYLGLLVTELFINSIKYAFVDQDERIISLQVFKENNSLKLNYKDNGENTIGKSITPNLIITICKQIKAEYSIESKEGFEIYISKILSERNGK
ncbi:tetratricopeptide repeat-containing sensor histidine kinase [Flavobacterium urocaniciphilum]|nr:sensor histidine kinase [Flavobacterium urocaniciphilum]